MAEHIDNSTRAHNFVAQHINCGAGYCGKDDNLCAGCADATEHLERLLNEAEDRGGERATELLTPRGTA